MVAEIIPWSPYRGRRPITATGRMSLTAAFGDLVESRTGYPPHDLPAIIAAPEDGEDNDALRDLVRLDAQLLAQVFCNGRINTFARPLGGGEIIYIPTNHWELDDPLPRFATGALNPDQWANTGAAPTHRIFVDSHQFNAWFASLKPLGPLPGREADAIADPQLRAVRAVAARSVEVSAGTTFDDGQPSNPSSGPPGVGPAMLTVKEVSQLIGRSVSSIYQDLSSGAFPEPIKLGSSSRWKETEIRGWIEEQAAKRKQR